MNEPGQPPTIYSTLEEAVEAFAVQADEPFELAEASDAVAATLRHLPAELDTAVEITLDESPVVFPGPAGRF